MSDKQTDFFSVSQSPGPELANFAELCNALYERELHSLAHTSANQPSLLKRKLIGLSYHIKNAAYFLCQHQAPLDVDPHNASFHNKQSLKSPSRKSDTEKNLSWFSQHAKPGLVVPIHVENLDTHHVELDCVDRVNHKDKLLHTNKYGWFSFYGEPKSSLRHTEQSRLLKPSKPIMQAACCGHTWNHKSRSMPRPLTLRELLLSAQINWQRFTLLEPKAPN